MDAYEAVQRGGLKLKGQSGVSDHGSKKKKKKSKEKKKIEDVLANTDRDEMEEIKSSRPSKTKAEIAFERRKQKKTQEQILERASKTHKERIMDFNEHLDNLTEHFDIPKVSWTK